MDPDTSAHPRAAASQEPSQRATDGHTFLCYAREDSSFVHSLTTYLRARAIPVWMDADIPIGADWDSTIDAQLRGCSNFLIVLSPAAVVSAEVRGELRMALNLAKPILPILYQSCDIPRQLQTLEYLDFSSADNADTVREALAAVLESTDRGPQRKPKTHPTTGSDGRTRQDFLDEVKSEVSGRLAQSLRAGPLNLLKEKQPDQVTRRWDREDKFRRQHRTPLGADTHIVQVFDEDTVGGKLLILGAPGSGKTTALLELGQELITRAERDVAAPVPAFCNLSSWHGQGLAVWLVDHLKVKYGVRKDHGHAWLNDRSLVPLLDGLDEVPPGDQEACVQAINAFQQDCHPRHIVVCCRLAQYENYRTKLQLNEAVRLLPLADNQIREYLLRAESPALWHDISGDREAMELARSPLLLRMIAVAFEEMSADTNQMLGSTSKRQAHLFDVYIRRVLSDDATSQPFSGPQVVAWLAWLAKTLREHGQAELLIERLQPTWLRSARQRLVYKFLVLVTVAVAFAGAMSLNIWLFGRFPQGAMGLAYANAATNLWGLAVVRQHDALPLTLIGLAAGLIVATRRSIQPIETLVWSWTRSWHGMVVGLRRMSLLGLNRIAYLGVPMGLLLGIQTLRDLWAADNLNPELSPFSSAGYIGAAIAMLTLGASILLTLRSGVWLVGRPSTWARGRPADAIVTGAAVGVGTWPYMGLLLAVSASLSLGLIVRLSGGSNLLSGSRFARALAVGLLGGFASGAITWWLPSVKRGFLDSVALGMLGGVGVAATAALFAGVADGFRQRRVAAVHPAERPAGGLRRLLGIVAIVAAVYGLMLGVAPYTGGLPFIRGITLMSARLGGGWVSGLSLSLMVVTIAGLFGMVTGAFLGALFGLLNGLTGPDIDRRTVPNQGIRQSAANVSVFALAGILIVGLPYGLMNLMIAAAWTRVAPQPLDWVHLTVAPAVLFGLAGGLVPGAACIQHLALRFVLWGCGVAPLRYVRFLNYATERMLLQRVGGRYRFIHDLLREHLAAMHPTSATARKG